MKLADYKMRYRSGIILTMAATVLAITVVVNYPLWPQIKLTLHNQFLQQPKLTKQLVTTQQSLRKPVFHIGFLKVHKCGSDTMSNIFFRFGLKHNLTFALPRKGVYIENVRSVMPLHPTGHFDILASHTVHSRKLFQSLLKEDTVNIAIVREPVKRMISAAYYYRDVWKITYLLRVPKRKFIESLVRYPQVYDKNRFSYTRNSMGRDFGFKQSISTNDTDEIEKYLDMLIRDFKLVLVNERFDESLVLMKRTLNWDMEDILYIKLNTNKHNSVTLNSNQIHRLEETCFLDFIVYKTFSKIFEGKVKAEGPGFILEVKQLKHVLQLLNRFCQSRTDRKVLTITRSEWNEPFSVTTKDCSFMQNPKLFELLKERQKKMANSLWCM